MSPPAIDREQLGTLLGLSADTSVALVGNANSLFGKRQGRDIDAHDLVMRLNYGRVREPEQQGSRTDILGCSDGNITMSLIQTMFAPRVVVWLTSKAVHEGFCDAQGMPLYINAREDWERVAREVEPHRPSSGAIAAHLLTQVLGVRKVRLFGFDFFDSPTFYHHSPWKFWRRQRVAPHSGASERQMMERLGIQVA